MKNIIIVILIFSTNLLLFINRIHIFQLNYYKLEKQIQYIKKNYKRNLYNLILNLLIIIFHNKLVFTLIIFLVFFKYNFSKKEKKKLVYTKKVIRYLIFSFLINIFFIVFFSYESILILNIFIDLEVIFIDIINRPINKIINSFYIRLAKRELKEFENLEVIGITGSYGKTSVKNYLHTLLSTKYNVLKTPKNFNTDLGVVKTIRENLNNIHEMFIVEMGATKVKDISNICKIIKPNISVITNIGKMHLESFKTQENIIKTKFEIFENSDVVFINLDDENIKNNMHKISNKKIITISSKYKNSDYYLHDIVFSNGKTNFKIKHKKNEINFETHLLGIHNIYNLFIALSIADYCDVKINKLKREVYNLKNVDHRLSLRKYNGITVIDDSYNSNEIGSKNALDVLKSFDGYKIVVTPGMVELGSEENKINYEFGKYIAKSCDEVILTNINNTKYINEALKNENFNNIKYIENINKVFYYIQNIKQESIVVLLENDLPDQYY